MHTKQLSNESRMPIISGFPSHKKERDEGGCREPPKSHLLKQFESE